MSTPWVGAGWNGHAPEVSVSRIALASGLTSVREARDWLTALLVSWRNQEARDDASLLLSEVATNAVRHARGATILITVTLTKDHLLAQVRDESAIPPVRRGAGEAGGWGLQLVDLLSSQWGVDQHPGDGKTIWFEMADANPTD